MIRAKRPSVALLRAVNRLIRPLLASSLYGMQKVRGSNPLSSTQGKAQFSNMKPGLSRVITSNLTI